MTTPDPTLAIDAYPQTPRSRVRRGAKRATYDRPTVQAILDAALLCTVATVQDGVPRNQPFSHWRMGDAVYLHGSRRNGLFAALAAGAEACLSVTVLDGLVWARSAMHHSVNYRSVVAYGRFHPVEGDAAKTEALRSMLDKYAPGRWAHVRPPAPNELKAVQVIAMPLAEVSAKVRNGPPVDDAEDLARPVWAGVMPLSLIWGDPVEHAAPASERPLAGLPGDLMPSRGE